ncbi:MAG: translation initiation factor IF-3 [Verrucomicrobiota bacterium]
MPRVDHRIRVREVLLIDENGKSHGPTPIQKAQSMAKAVGLNLVEVASKARPPVCKILDFGKYKYEMAKKEKDNKKPASATKVKELKFHMNIDGHDYETKLKHAEQFMFKGHKVKILMQFRGREMMHTQIGRDVLKRIVEDMVHIATPDFEPKLVGRNMTLMFTPLPANKRTRRFTVEDDDFEQDDEAALDEEAHDETPGEAEDDIDAGDDEGEDASDNLEPEKANA